VIVSLAVEMILESLPSNVSVYDEMSSSILKELFSPIEGRFPRYDISVFLVIYLLFAVWNGDWAKAAKI
jgi:hypothetical protein